ncbi:hypothetical protein GWG65_23970 [Bradyrhizobium sp. CSA207]|uniref:adenylate/guanylate cyclase domain-containing protein n=1 Tax=Bradyrhizobium sp. CSA207 TaxID=2698826 RepID=UPI0023D2F7B1|nr:hypothetical protein [Bradyrhizobium sp. CSA207]
MASDQTKRKLAAILAADIAGYSRLMGADEEGTLARLKLLRRELIDPKNKQHHARIVKTTGDGILIEFPSVVDAVRCAIEVQQGMVERNADVPQEKRIEFRVGVNLGDVKAETSMAMVSTSRHDLRRWPNPAAYVSHVQCSVMRAIRCLSTSRMRANKR